MKPIRVLIWNEGRHEKLHADVQRIYPAGLHGALADGLRVDPALEVRTALLDDPEQGLSEARLRETDVLMWWGHLAHAEVAEAAVDRVVRRVHEGLGLIVLHSGHWSKPFKRLMGTTANLRWREANEREVLWVVNPSHPITAGLPQHFELRDEMYGEFFDVPEPEELVFLGWFEGGDVFRSGCTWRRGKGRIFYFQPGHETCAVYHHEHIRRILRNAAHWARFQGVDINTGCIKVDPLFPIAPTA